MLFRYTADWSLLCHYRQHQCPHSSQFEFHVESVLVFFKFSFVVKNRGAKIYLNKKMSLYEFSRALALQSESEVRNLKRATFMLISYIFPQTFQKLLSLMICSWLTETFLGFKISSQYDWQEYFLRVAFQCPNWRYVKKENVWENLKRWDIFYLVNQYSKMYIAV